MAAVLIPSYLVPIARTNADWAMDIVFQGEDWTDSTVSVIFGRRGLPGYSVEATIGDGLLAPTAELTVALRIPASTWAAAPAADYTVQVRRLKGGAIDDAATFTLKLEKGLDALASASAPILSGAGDFLGGVVVDRVGAAVSVVRAGGVQGPKGDGAYQEALAAGFVGDREAWLASLVGPPPPVPIPKIIPDQVYVLQAEDVAHILMFTAPGDALAVVPAGLPAGFNVQLMHVVEGTLAVTGLAATIRAASGKVATNVAYQRMTLTPLIGSDEYLVTEGTLNPGPPLRIVGTRGESPQNFGLVSSATRVTIESRARVFFGRQPTSEQRLALCGIYCDINGQGIETPLGNAVPYECALEFNGVVVRYLWNGANVKSVASGEDLVFSDPIMPAAFGLTEFPAGGGAFVRMRSTVAVGERTLVGPQLTSAGEGGFQHSGATNQLMATGPMVLPAGGTNRPAAPPFFAMLGRWASAPDVSVVISGASQIYGQGDNLGDGESGGGYAKRALWSAGKVPWVNIARPSNRGENANLYTKRQAIYAFATHDLGDYGTNDQDVYRLTADSDVAVADAVRSILRTQWAAQRRAGLHITQMPITPRLTSNDRFKTAAGQTAINRNGQGQARDILNGYLVEDLAAGLFDEFFDINPMLVDPAQPWKFKTDGVTEFLTSPDGVHYAIAVHIALAAALRALVMAWEPR